MGGAFQSVLTVTGPAPSSIAGGTFANDGFLLLQNTRLSWTGGSITTDPAQFYGLSQPGVVYVGASAGDEASLTVSGFGGVLGSNVTVYGTMTLAGLSSNVFVANAVSIDVAAGGTLSFANSTLGLGVAGGLVTTGALGSIQNYGTISDTATDGTATPDYVSAAGATPTPSLNWLQEDLPIVNYSAVTINSPNTIGVGELSNVGEFATVQLAGQIVVTADFTQEAGSIVVPAGATAGITSVSGNVSFDGVDVVVSGTLAVNAAAGDVSLLNTDYSSDYTGSGFGSLSVTCQGALSTGGVGQAGGFTITLWDTASAQPSAGATYQAFAVQAGGGWLENDSINVVSPNQVWGISWNTSRTVLDWTA